MTVKDIRPALFQFLKADAGIAAATLESAGKYRIYPIVLPQGIKASSIVYTRVSGRGDHHMAGPSGLNRPRIQVDAWSPTTPAAAALADLVKTRLDGFRGVMDSGGDAVTVQGVFYTDEREDYDDVAKLYRVGRDYFFNFEEV